MPEDYEIIGTRAGSTFRVPDWYFNTKRHKFAPGVDPTTGGPCVVVYAGTDTPVPNATIRRGAPDDPNTGRVETA